MFVYLLLYHFILDFYAQPKKLVDFKSKNILKGNILHSLIVGFGNFIFLTISKGLIYLDMMNIIYISLIILISHFIIDILKSLFLKKSKATSKQDLYAFIIDQIAHIIVLIVITAYIKEYSLNGSIPLAEILVCLILLTTVSSHIIKKILLASNIEIPNNSTEEEGLSDENKMGHGALIGKLERLCVFILLLCNIPYGVVTVYGLKQLGRISDFKNKQSAEYYIIGNLLSIFMVLLIYIAIIILYKDFDIFEF